MHASFRALRSVWWIDLLRGGITLVFGLVLIFDSAWALHLLGRVLGAYLLVDGSINLYLSLAQQRRNGHLLDSVSSILIIAVGLLGILEPAVTLAVLFGMVAAHAVIRGWQFIRSAVRERSSFSGIAWISGFALILLALVVVFFPTHALRSIYVLLIISTISIGVATIVSTLLRHVAPRQASVASQPDSLPLNANGEPSARRALVFVRRQGASGLGHIGWSFEWQNGWFNAGSVENEAGKPVAAPEAMGFWTMHTLDPVGAMQTHTKPYDEYKLCLVSDPAPKQAWQTVAWISKQPYVALRRNCNDDAYDVLRSYGVTDIPDPSNEFVPNNWYDAYPGRSYRIADHPQLPLALHMEGSHPPNVQSIPLTIPDHLQAVAPPWQQPGKRWWVQLDEARAKMLLDIRALGAAILAVRLARTTPKSGNMA